MEMTLLTLFWVQHPTHNRKCTAHFPSWTQTRVTSPAACCRDVRGEGPQCDASASPVPWAPFPVLCVYIIYVQQQGGAVDMGTSRSTSPMIPIFTRIPLPVPLSCGEIHPCGAWAGPSLCQHSHLGPNQGLTAPLRARACHPKREQEEAGPRVQECGHSPHLGRAVLGGASGCLEPLPWIHVELIGQEDAGCPVSGGGEASTWCLGNTAHPGPRVVDPPPWSSGLGAVCRHLLCFPVWGEMGTGLSCHPGPESLLAGPVLEVSSSLLGPEFGGFSCCSWFSQMP